jgi:hypothetical protein
LHAFIDGTKLPIFGASQTVKEEDTKKKTIAQKGAETSILKSMSMVSEKT